MILVTGASGIVGSQIVRELLSKNDNVRAIKRGSSDISLTRDINDDIEWVEADILDLMNLDKAFIGITYVIHCAAMVSFDNSHNEEMHTINIEGTKNVLALCLKHQIEKLVYISSVAALGRSATTNVVDETSKWQTSSLNTSYATSKYLAELEVWRAQEEGLATIILNPSVVVGPGSWNSSSMKLLKHVSDGSPFYPTGTLNVVDVKDVAIIATKFLFNKIESERYILSSEKISFKDYFSLIAKAMNKKAPLVKLVPSLAMFAASILKAVRIFTGVKFTLTKEAVMLSQLNILFSSEKIKSELNYNFRTAEESIIWTCEQIKNNVTEH